MFGNRVMLQHIRHRSNGLARILLAVLLIGSGAIIHFFDTPTNTGPRILRTANDRLADCTQAMRDSLATRLACGDPLDKRR
jgi:phage-related protein